MQNILKKLVWACLLVIPFVALYVASGNALDIVDRGTSGLFFPFISGKNLLFRLLVDIAFFGWVALALGDAKYRINVRKNPLFIAYAVFMVVLLLADAFGADPFKSFWSNFERMEGFAGHIHFFAYFVVLTAMLHTAADYGKMWKALIASNIAVLVFGLGQLLGAPGYIFSNVLPGVAAKFAHAFPIHMSENRLDATLGNSAYFAVYCLMFIFILGLRWSERRGEKNTWWYPALIALNLVALFYTGTRGTQIGLLIGGFITLGLVAWHEKGKARKTIAGALVVIALLVVSVFAFKNTSFIKNSPTLARFASISPTDLTGMSRLSIWKISFDAWKEHPVLGYGQENFSNIYAEKFIPEKMWMLESWYDRSHDVFFDWLVAAGALGLISYLALYAVALWLMWKKKNDMPFQEKAILTGALAGYFVHNIFVFDNLISYILFFFLLAYIAFKTGSRGEVHTGKAFNQDKMNMLYLPLIGIVFVAVVYTMIYRPFMVNRLLVRGLDINRLIQTMSFADAVKVQQASFEKAVGMHTLGSEEAREQFLQMAVSLSQVTIPADVPAEDKQKSIQAVNGILASARQEITNSYEAHKNDVRALSIYGMFYNGTGDGVSAEKVLTVAHTLAPKKQLISFDLVRAYLLENKLPQAYELGQETYDLAPAFPDAAKYYLISAVYAGKWNEARAHIVSSGKEVPFDTDVLSALVNTKQIPQAVQFLNDYKKANPQYTAQIDAYIKQILAAPAK